MIIETVKEFNRKAKIRYRENVKNFEFGKGGFPYLPMYIFTRENGEIERKRGFVITEGNRHIFKLTKKEVRIFINKEII